MEMLLKIILFNGQEIMELLLLVISLIIILIIIVFYIGQDYLDLLEDCIFLNNTVSTNTTSENSNVVYWTGNNGTLKHSIFKYNNGTTGAVYWIGDNGNINYCNFTFNLASYKGGAILWEGINGILSNSLLF